MLSSPPRPAWLLGGPDEGVIDGLDNEVEMQGILHQVLGVAPLQVGVRQEVTGLLAALVEAVGVADQQAAVVARPHQHGLLEAHARRVAAAAGRRDHQPGPAVLGACEGQRCARGVRVDRPQAYRQPRGEKSTFQVTRRPESWPLGPSCVWKLVLRSSRAGLLMTHGAPQAGAR